MKRLAAAALLTLFALPAMAAYECRHVDVVSTLTGVKLAGIEDLAYHPPSGNLILSVHDRWGDRDGRFEAQWGLFRLPLDQLETGQSSVRADPARKGEAFLDEMKPHGIALRQIDDGSWRLLVINHRFLEEESGPLGLPGTMIEEFEVDPEGHLTALRSVGHPALCPANDLDWIDGDRALVSLDRTNCGGLSRFLELARGQWRGRLAIVDLAGGGEPFVLAEKLGFPNGVAVRDDETFVAFSREERLARYRLTADGLVETGSWPLNGGGDNLAFDSAGRLLLAVHPDLFDFGLYTLRVWGFGSAPTRMVRFSPDGEEREILLESQDGKPLSGVTSFVEARDLLVGGAAFDEGIAVCEEK
ncbi:MAG: hypothetical protein ACMVY4_12470 [Minwuia sp.]|uniref:hypothetical protein n=1 Tax=Minwuia sp. TaxID=2493630 RepID=UPI003A838A98